MADLANDETDPYTVLRDRLLRKLGGFSDKPAAMASSLTMVSYRPEKSSFPVPELVLFALRDVLGWPWHGVGEKVRWTVHGAIDGQPVGFELRKFGFTVIRPKDRDDLDARIQGQLRSALLDVEQFLRPVANAQVAKGEVLIVNRFSEFSERYRFFREHADSAYTSGNAPPPARSGLSEDVRAIQNITDHMNWTLSAQREGFFYSTAMVDSYFSCLEHRLVLLRAFSGKPLEENELLNLLAARWDDKLKMILPAPLSHEAGAVLGQMRRVKERIRNPFAHGGVENDQGSLFFHLPRIGTVPANFSRFADSVRFSFLPVEASDHAECCAVFDKLDTLLSTGDFECPHQLLDNGVDPAFDLESLKTYAEAIDGGPEGTEAFIKHWSDMWERHANMDY